MLRERSRLSGIGCIYSVPREDNVEMGNRCFGGDREGVEKETSKNTTKPRPTGHGWPIWPHLYLELSLRIPDSSALVGFVFSTDKVLVMD
jgi:hypothetical protein